MTFNKYKTLAALAATTNAISIKSEAQGDHQVGIGGTILHDTPISIGNPVSQPDSEHVSPPFDPSIIDIINSNPVPILDTNTLPAQLSITVSQLMRLQSKLDELMRTVCPTW